MVAPRTILVDGDMVAYTAAYAPQTNVPAAEAAVKAVRRYQTELGAARAIVCFSDPSRTYWRHGVWPTYKANRNVPPAELPACKAALQGAYVCRTIPTLEADDVMGVLATTLQGPPVVCVSNDKDMLCVPGWHYNPQGGFKYAVHVSPRQAAYNHMLMTLAGDSCDGYPGIKGVGPKKAARTIWGDPAGWWQQVVGLYRANKKAEEDALAMARLARILHREDYRIDEARVVLWEPARLMEVAGA